jgi:NADH-quinone oxidoreductase subunit A
MPIELLNLLLFVLLGAGFLLVTLTLGKLLRPSAPSVDKGLNYECGERPIGPGWFNFNPRFYVIALVFLIFDVEVAFTYPVAVVFKRWISRGDAVPALLEIGAFIAVLAFALGYVWRRGDLEWLRQLKR